LHRRSSGDRQMTRDLGTDSRVSSQTRCHRLNFNVIAMS
jgi:hypothetical protein